MKKFLLIVISLVYLLTFVACGTSTNIDTSSADPLRTTTCEVYPHACYDKSKDGGYIGGDGYCDVCNKSLEKDFESSDAKTDEKEFELYATPVAETKHYCFIDGEYQDSSFDRLCDVCGDDLAHYCNDANGDGQCDKCFASFGIAHRDTTGDGYCDIHKKCKTYLLDHDCCDKNTDYECDLCYLPF